MDKIIDAHIHFDQYAPDERNSIIRELPWYNIQALISVSWDLHSAQKNLELARRLPSVFPAVGHHPEQALPENHELKNLLQLIDRHQDEIVAIGEIGLPLFTKRATNDKPPTIH